MASPSSALRPGPGSVTRPPSPPGRGGSGSRSKRRADSNTVANSTAVWCLAPADQFGKQAVEGLIRRGVVECLPGPIVEAGGDQVELALVQPGQGAAFRQVLAQQAVGVLVGAPLPG